MSGTFHKVCVEAPCCAAARFLFLPRRPLVGGFRAPPADGCVSPVPPSPVRHQPFPGSAAALTLGTKHSHPTGPASGVVLGDSRQVQKLFLPSPQRKMHTRTRKRMRARAHTHAQLHHASACAHTQLHPGVHFRPGHRLTLHQPHSKPVKGSHGPLGRVPTAFHGEAGPLRLLVIPVLPSLWSSSPDPAALTAHPVLLHEEMTAMTVSTFLTTATSLRSPSTPSLVDLEPQAKAGLEFPVWGPQSPSFSSRV